MLPKKTHEVPHLVLMLPPNPTWHPMWRKKLEECIMNGISTPLLICFMIFFMKYNDSLQT